MFCDRKNSWREIENRMISVNRKIVSQCYNNKEVLFYEEKKKNKKYFAL